jgi:hypothetical protein
VIVTVRDPGPVVSRASGGRTLVAVIGGVALVIVALSLIIPIIYDLRRTPYRSRNFFGTLAGTRENVGTPEGATQLRHGATAHGLQLLDPSRRDEPLSYFSPQSGIGLALRNHPRRLRGEPLRVGIVGLGIGTLAAYSRPGDSFRFYEINPEVVRLSSSSDPMFTFLRDALGQVTTVIGDGRVSLEREPSQRFDLLVLDAFNSDAIPIHLLTREAFELYLRHLNEPDGILAVQATNRTLDLVPVVQAVATELGLVGVSVTYTPPAGDRVTFRNRWILLSRRPSTLRAPEIVHASVPLTAGEQRRIWTDNFSNLLSALK